MARKTLPNPCPRGARRLTGLQYRMADEDKILDFLRERFNRINARLEGMARDIGELRVTGAANIDTLRSRRDAGRRLAAPRPITATMKPRQADLAR